jgi:hypothetical protein
MKSAGEITDGLNLTTELEEMRVVKPPKAKTSRSMLREHKFLDAAKSSNARYPNQEEELTYLTRALVQCTLPHADPGNIECWERSNGGKDRRRVLTIQPGRVVGKDGKTISARYPFGTPPRLILMWICTRAIQTGSRKIYLGPTFSEFLRRLGLHYRNGGPKSTRSRVKSQITALFSANITSYEMFGDDDRQGEATTVMNVVGKRELWWKPTDPDQTPLWDSWIELGEGFYDLITSHAIPFNLERIGLIKSSALALDLYMLCSYESATLMANWMQWNIKGKIGPRPKTNRCIRWSWLAQQMGSQYANVDDFKRKVKAEMRRISIVNPRLKFGYDNQKGGLVIHASSLDVPRQKTFRSSAKESYSFGGVSGMFVAPSTI